MRIASATLHHVQIPLRKSFAHALSDRSGTDAVLVELADEDGTVGWGEILPRAYVTGETVASVWRDQAVRLLGSVLGQTVADQDAALALARGLVSPAESALATACGVELALLDLCGRRLGFSLASCLGEFRGPELPAGVVIGFETPTETLGRYCAVVRLAGKRHIKVKVGLPDDVARCAAVAQVFGADTPLRIDANAAWTPTETLDKLRALAEVCPLHSVEQPVAKTDLEGLRYVRQHGGTPVMADESVCALADADALIEADAVDWFNVRLGKHGGVLASAAVCARAQQAGVRVHLGTLVGETGILSRAAEVFGQCQPGLDCLDGKGQNRWLLRHDVLQSLPEAPTLAAHGLGVNIDRQLVLAASVADPVHLRGPQRAPTP